MNRTLMILLLSFFMMSSAQANGSEFKSNTFSFEKVHSVLILSSENHDIDKSLANDVALEKINQTLIKAFAQKKVRVVFIDEAINEFNRNHRMPYATLVEKVGVTKAIDTFFKWASSRYESYLHTSVLNYSAGSKKMPATTSKRVVMERRTLTDIKGRVIIIEEPETIYDKIAEHNFITSQLCLEFILVDSKTNSVIYSFKDEREREETNKFDGMVEKMADNIAGKVYENFKNTRI